MDDVGNARVQMNCTRALGAGGTSWSGSCKDGDPDNWNDNVDSMRQKCALVIRANLNQRASDLG